MYPITFSLFILSFLSLLICSEASFGDRNELFQFCLLDCSNQCSASEGAPITRAVSYNSDQFTVDIQSQEFYLSWFDREIMRWSCEDNCNYQCMQKHHNQRAERSLEPVKYYGKWPFIRVLGHQELFSSWFSWLNMLPHCYFVVKYYKVIPSAYPMRNFWLVYGISYINTWLWSAVFHARDNIVTERLDYFCACFSILLSCAIFSIRALNIQKNAYKALIILLCLTFFTCHVSYMQFVKFDYGWNMLVNAGAGVIYTLFFVCWAFYHGRDYMKAAAYGYIAILLLGMLEIFDFPPLLQLLDAHAFWHGSTPYLQVLFWRFLLADAEFELESKTQINRQKWA
jgi:hypothetical protein